MGWKTINGRRYYYQSERVGGRVRSSYVGSDETALLIATLDADARRERRDAREADREVRRAAEAEDREVAAWFARVEAVAEGVLIAAGFHRHDRGHWRRRRMADEPAPIKPRAVPPWSDREAVNELIERGRKGEKAALPKLQALFSDPGRNPDYLDAYGSPPSWLENCLSDLAAGENQAVRAAIQAKLAEVRRDLEGPNPSPIERLLAERAAFCWFIVHRYETYYARAGEQTLRQADYYQRRIDRAHARFLSALKTLATVRKLALPALQVNIGANQLNTIGVGRE